MRGEDERSGSLFSYVDLEALVGKDHPLRTPGHRRRLGSPSRVFGVDIGAFQALCRSRTPSLGLCWCN
jgi:hypothetical protein